MFFNKISLTGYKNYQSKTFHFTERIIGICGLNGKGKTNLLDAINYLCFTKSYFTKSDLLNVHFGSEGFRIEGELQNGNIEDNEVQKIVCIYRSSLKKEIYLNDIAYEKFSHHIGKFPCVVIAPDDIEMITGNSEERRKFMDTLISQVDTEYLQQLIIYNKVLAQRNSFLKNEFAKNTFDKSLLEVLDEQLKAPGNYIHKTRDQFCNQLFPLVQEFYNNISGKNEEVNLEYNSQLNENNFSELLISSRQKDRVTQRTNVGIHKDDLTFLLFGNIFKSIASQGQRKSLLFACKLAEFEILKKVKGYPPVLLLDDVFEKLDENRIENLLEYVCQKNNGQVFITDTHFDRLKMSLSPFGNAVQVIELA
ncbi:MAG: DNA replication and repair protein RecF [Bacteroidota bacterium]|nr:DNA replication and repair protein RecF [Bacteroidota bacterium]